MRVPKRFKEATLSSVDRVVFESVHEWFASLSRNVDDGKGLLIGGPPGVGKTWALTALLRAVSSKLRVNDYEWVTAPDLFDRLDVAGDAGVDVWRDQSWWDTYCSCKILLLNDLGKEYRGGKLAEQVPYKFGRVLRSRSEQRLLTFITTNLSGSTLRETYGDSIESLLQECTWSASAIGPDRRKGGSQ